MDDWDRNFLHSHLVFGAGVTVDGEEVAEDLAQGEIVSGNWVKVGDYKIFEELKYS